MSNARSSKKTKHISLALRTTVAVVALLWVFRDQDWSQLAKVFARLNLWYFTISLVIFLISQILIGLRWWLLLRAQSVKTSFTAAVRLHFLGLFYNNLMPGSVGGDILRAWYVTKHTDKKLESALSVFVDRAIGLLAMLAIAIFCYLLFMRGQSHFASSQSNGKDGFLNLIAEYKWIFIGLFIGTAVLLCFVLSVRPIRTVALKTWSYFYTQMVKVIEKSKNSIIIYCNKPLTILTTIVLTILLQSMVISSFWLLGINLRVSAGARYYFVFFPITWILAALPVSIAGIGVLEGGIREFFTRFAGAGIEEVLALALCQRFIWVLASLPGAVIHLTGTHLPKDFSIDDKKSIN